MNKNSYGEKPAGGRSTGSPEPFDRLAVKPARAALLLDCSRTKIYDAINRGELRAVRISGMLRIPVDEIRRRLDVSLAEPDANR